MPDLIFARPDGQWFDLPPVAMAGISGNRLVRPGKHELIPLPEGATLTMMPMACPIGIDKDDDQFVTLEENPYKQKAEPIYAMAALLPQGFTRLLMPAATLTQEPLPLLGYTAVGIEKGKLMVAAMATDEHENWHPKNYNTNDLANLIAKRKKEFPGNSIIEQLAHCAAEYGCFTAQNIFYRRFEGGIPVSPACNADCLGCISLQESECCPSPQQRISKAPSVKEIAEIGFKHLNQAKEGIISFGQGCEGEPSLQYQIIGEAIEIIRRQTDKGIININTNAGHRQAFKHLLEAGIDSMRISIFSPIAKEYEAYHRPKNYSFDDVLANLELAKSYPNCQISLNLLLYPGFSDDDRRFEALVNLLKDSTIKQVQLRNLNIDPKVMVDFCKDSWGMGVYNLVRRLKEELPDLKIGNYSRNLSAEPKNKKN